MDECLVKFQRLYPQVPIQINHLRQNQFIEDQRQIAKPSQTLLVPALAVQRPSNVSCQSLQYLTIVWQLFLSQTFNVNLIKDLNISS